MEEENKKSFLSKLKRIILSFCLLPIHFLILVENFALLSLLGFFNNIYILIARKKIKRITEAIYKTQLMIHSISLDTFILDGLVDEKKEVEEEKPSRLVVLYRLIGFPIYFLVISFYALLQIPLWLILMFDYVRRKENIDFRKKIALSFDDIFNINLYLSGLNDETAKVNWLDNWFPAFCFVFLLDWFLIRMEFLPSYSALSAPFLTLVIIAIIMIYILIYVYMIPGFLHIPTLNSAQSSKEIRHLIGIKKPKKPLKDIMIALGITALILILLYGIDLIITYDNYTNGIFEINWKYIYYYFVEGLEPGIVEEIIYRGLLITIFRKRFSISKSIIFSSIAFGAAHFLFSIPYTDMEYMIYRLVQMVYTTIIGITFGLFFVVTGSLLGPIIIHSLYDFVVYFIQFKDTTVYFYEYILLWAVPVVSMIIVTISYVYALRISYDRPELLRFRKIKRNKEYWSKKMRSDRSSSKLIGGFGDTPYASLLPCSSCSKKIPETSSFCKYCGKKTVFINLFCDHCGRSIDLNSSFCKYCGEKTNFGEIFCKNCEKTIDNDSVFCSHCGEKQSK